VALYRTKVRGMRLEQLQQGGTLLITEVTSAIITVLAAKQVIAGSLTLGGLLAVQYLVGQVTGPLSQLAGLVQSVQGAKLSLDRMAEVFESAEESAGSPQPPCSRDGASIAVESVTFGYRGLDGPQVLRGVDLVIPSGKVTAIVGSSGSGKSTLLKLLLKFYDPLRGVIRLGERDLRTVGHENWRRRCGAVMQDGYLFSDTIARNIALGRDVDLERLARAARQACIADAIEGLPLAYDTKVGANGVGLSHGQRQRILIARALYHDPEFLFLDEATSSLDAESERQIVANLEEVFRHRTVVVIAHRLSTVKRADRIVVIERGTVAEAGTHEELVLRNGRYLELVRNQLELQRRSPSATGG
jgi:ATP-binding cassette, subfamily B, bacterial